MEPTEEPALAPPDLRRGPVRRVATGDPVDLSPVDSPYVRETETQLDRVLAAAEEHEAVLLLDEADPDQPSTSEP